MDYSIKTERGKSEGEEGWVFDVGSLVAQLSTLRDRRDPRGVRYPLAVILVIVILAKLAGEDEPLGIAEWAKHRAAYLVKALKLKRESMPHEVTYSRVLGGAVEVAEFEEMSGEYLSHSAGTGVIINIDGKTLRGTIPKGQTQGLHLLAAYMPEKGVVLMQIEVDKKENEIVVAPKLLDCLDLEGKIVTGDAMFAQRKLSVQVVEAGGDYLWTVKANQATLLGDIQRLFEPTYCPPGTSPMQDDFASASSTDSKHGRLERRTITTSSMLKDYTDWPHAAQVFKLERRVRGRRNNREESCEVAYGITSLSADAASPERLLTLTRRHWGIENELHYPRDVTFREDACRLKMGNAARVMAIINNLVLGLIKQQDFDYAPQARRFYNAHPQAALDLILRT
jgi:predicted transposase YbfD/YdcC